MSYCCINCFKDPHIIETIKKENVTGNCDFCASKNIPVIEIKKDNPVSERILRLIQIYSVSDNEKAKPLKESLRDDWDIFNGGCEIIQTLVKALCSDEVDDTDDIFNKRVIISQMYDDDYQNEFGLLRGLSWLDFSEYIKYKNRFHNSYFNPEAFASFLTVISQEIDESSLFYRARISYDSSGFKLDQMSAPPKGMRRPGRINPEEICVLYLSSDQETVLYETRANVYDFITIGTFRAKKKLKVVNLSGLSKISPFMYDESLMERFAINRSVFQDMAQEIAKPIRRNDSPFEYLPTQFISEFIKSQGYDGVAYESTIKKSGLNYALFDESVVECIRVNTVEIKSINYSTEN